MSITFFALFVVVFLSLVLADIAWQRRQSKLGPTHHTPEPSLYDAFPTGPDEVETEPVIYLPCFSCATSGRVTHQCELCKGFGQRTIPASICPGSEVRS